MSEKKFVWGNYTKEEYDNLIKESKEFSEAYKKELERLNKEKSKV